MGCEQAVKSTSKYASQCFASELDAYVEQACPGLSASDLDRLSEALSRLGRLGEGGSRSKHEVKR